MDEYEPPLPDVDLMEGPDWWLTVSSAFLAGSIAMAFGAWWATRSE